MRNEITVTLVGWAATAPREIVAGGTAWTSFRLATTPRRFDTSTGGWVDGRTEWVTVKAFRELALNVARSVHKGEPVIAVGRLRTDEWEGENGTRQSLVLDAHAVGHDLARGRTEFVRRVHVAAEEDVSGAGELDPGVPGATEAAGEDAGGGLRSVEEDSRGQVQEPEDGAGEDGPVAHARRGRVAVPS